MTRRSRNAKSLPKSPSKTIAPRTGARDSLNYFSLASQYYVCGRAGVFAGCLPVSGNLLHHAVELFLKGDLCRSLSREDLKRQRHELRKLWRTFKNLHAGVPLSQHDDTIKALDKFEKIRYPDAITDLGMVGAITVAGPIPILRPGPIPNYVLDLSAVDRLARSIFDAASVNPQFNFGMLPKDARAAIYRANGSFTP
jgi:hypothetical protein